MNKTLTKQPAVESGNFTIGGDLPVRRLGYGTMQLTGAGVWGEPASRSEASPFSGARWSLA